MANHQETIEELSPYNYTPTLYVCVIFISLFALTTITHLAQTFKRRMWWLIPTMVACGLCEVIGWSGRLWSSKNPILMDPFMMQICTTIIAPSFMTAAMFIILGKIINIVGTQYSRLRPKIYTVIFIIADVAALVVQAVGGAMASIADTPEGSEDGAKIMVAGIIVQMAAITIYTLLASEYLFRVYTNRPLRPAQDTSHASLKLNDLRGDSYTSSTLQGADNSSSKADRPAALTPNIKKMLIGLSISTLFIYVRSIYRTIELLDGWSGRIISNETLFNVLDAMPIFVAMFTLNVFHPGRLLPEESPKAVLEIA